MLTFESYRDVLSANAHSGHVIASGWVVVVAIAVALILFA